MPLRGEQGGTAEEVRRGYQADQKRQMKYAKPHKMNPMGAVYGLVLAAGLGCRPATVETPALLATSSNHPPWLEAGQAITSRAFTLLSSNLVWAIANGGISHALPYCSDIALPLVTAVGDSNAVTLRRVTHKPRNPANRATESELAILNQFQTLVGQGQPPAPVVETNAQGAVSFFAPIVLNNPLCLNCHGQPGVDIAAEHTQLIRQRYPGDEATGFKLGELRGMWRVDFRASLPTPPAP